VRKGIAGSAMLVLGITSTQPKDEPSTCEEVQRGRNLRGDRWIAIALSQDQCAPAHTGVLTGVIGEKGQALENRISAELEVIDHPTGEIELGGSLQDPFVRTHHLGQAATMWRRSNGDPEVYSDHYSRDPSGVVAPCCSTSGKRCGYRTGSKAGHNWPADGCRTCLRHGLGWAPPGLRLA